MSESRHDRLSRLFLELSGQDEADAANALTRLRRDDAVLADELEAMLDVATDAPSHLSTGAFHAEPGSFDRPIPETVGPYLLQECLGEGGMGVVFRAMQQEPLRREVAVKLIRPGFETTEILDRFERERQSLAVMSHPCIARVLDAGETAEGWPYFAMELVDGDPLHVYCEALDLPLTQRLKLFGRICDGVTHAHQKGVIHRDLKPSNVLIEVVDGVPTPKIIDFGIAKAVSDASPCGKATSVGAPLLGTPDYMSPEQAAPGVHPIDTRTDIHALGLILYSLLADTVPFSAADDPSPLLERHRQRVLTEQPLPPSRRAPASRRKLIRGDLDTIVLRALRKDPAKRYANVGELAEDIRRHLTHRPIRAEPARATYRAAKFVRRNRSPIAIALVLSSILLIGSFIFLRQQRVEREARLARSLAETMVTVIDPSLNSISWRQGLQSPIENLAERTRRSAARLDDQPFFQAVMIGAMGGMLSNTDHPSRAIPLLERSWQQLTRLQRQATPPGSGIGRNLAATYSRNGDHEQAVTLLRSLLAGQKAQVMDTREPLFTEMQLGLTLKAAGQLEDARTTLEHVCPRLDEELGTESPRSLVCRGWLAGVHVELKQFDTAAQLLATLVDAMERARHPRDTEYGAMHYNLAAVAAYRGDFESALLHLEKAATAIVASPAQDPAFERLATDTRFQRLARRFQLNSSEVRFQRRQQGMLAWNRGDVKRAELLLRDILAATRSQTGESSVETIASIEDLAYFLTLTGRHDDAGPLFLESLDKRARLPGDGLAEADVSLWGVGLFHLHNGRDREAAATFRRAAARARTDGWIDAAEPYYEAAALCAEKRFDEAVEHLSRHPQTRGLVETTIQHDPALQRLSGHAGFRHWLQAASPPGRTSP